LLPLPLPLPKLLLTPKPGLHLMPQRRLLLRSLQRPKLTPLPPQNRERPLLVLYNCQKCQMTVLKKPLHSKPS
jgi:hypothetical protein